MSVNNVMNTLRQHRNFAFNLKDGKSLSIYITPGEKYIVHTYSSGYDDAKAHVIREDIFNSPGKLENYLNELREQGKL